MTVNERIKIIIDTFEEGTVLRFAKKTGAAHTSIATMLPGTRESKPGFDLISKILEAYPTISTDWFIRGEGEMTKRQGNGYANPTLNHFDVSEEIREYQIAPATESLADHISGKNLRVITEVVDISGNTLIPKLDIKAAAGLPSNLDNGSYFRNLPMISRPEAVFRQGNWLYMQADGDSMHPTIMHKQWFYCQQVLNWNEIKGDRVYMVVLRSGPVIKRLYKRPDEEKAIALSSDNTFIKPWIEPLENVLQIWNVKLYEEADLSNKALLDRNAVANMRIELEETRHRLEVTDSYVQELREGMQAIERLLNK